MPELMQVRSVLESLVFIVRNRIIKLLKTCYFSLFVFLAIAVWAKVTLAIDVGPQIRHIRNDGTNDTRKDWYEFNHGQKQYSDSTVSIWSALQVRDNQNGTSKLYTSTWTSVGGKKLLEDEPFKYQQVGAFCSGFLMTKRVVATAGHCLDGMQAGNLRFVFGFRMTSKDEDLSNHVISNENIYKGVSLKFKNNNSEDYGLVWLDRDVVGHEPVLLSLNEKVLTNAPVQAFGHPYGLPLKVTSGEVVTVFEELSKATFFQTNLDTYPGNSGSPVFNKRTGKVIGIHVSGRKEAYKEKNGVLHPTFANAHSGIQGATPISKVYSWLYEQDGGIKDFHAQKKLAQEGNKEALYQLARMYEQGQGVSMNQTSALHYYNMASKKGHARAKYEIGRFYELGIAVEKSIPFAIHYYSIAKQKGIIEAQAALNRVNK